MIGLPGQTIEDLVQDIRTFEKVGADMIGMGPYLTSLGATWCRSDRCRTTIFSDSPST